MGLVGFFQRFTGSSPSVYTLTDNKFAIKHLGNYSLALAGSHTDPSSIILKQLDYLHQLLVFYLHSITSIEGETQDASMKDQMTHMWDSFWPFVRRYGDNLAAAFEVIPILSLPPPGGTVILRASHLLQKTRSVQGVLGGTVLCQSRILLSELSPAITGKLLLIRPHQSHLPCRKIIPDYPCPNGVRLMKVYITPSEYVKLAPNTQLIYEDSSQNTYDLSKSDSSHMTDLDGETSSKVRLNESLSNEGVGIDESQCDFLKTKNETSLEESLLEDSENMQESCNNSVRNNDSNNANNDKLRTEITNDYSITKHELCDTTNFLRLTSDEDNIVNYPALEIASSPEGNIGNIDNENTSGVKKDIIGPIATGAQSQYLKSQTSSNDNDDNVKRGLVTLNKSSLMVNIKKAAEKGALSIKGKNGRNSIQDYVKHDISEQLPMQRSPSLPAVQNSSNTKVEIDSHQSVSNSDGKCENVSLSSRVTPPVKTMDNVKEKTSTRLTKGNAHRHRNDLKKTKKSVVVDKTGVIEAELYIQGNSDIVVILVMEKGSACKKDTVTTLWKIIMSQMGELDGQLKHYLSNVQQSHSTSPPSYNYLLYDAFSKSLKGRISLSGNSLRPMSSQENDFCETATMLHEEFNQHTSLSHVTLRKHSGAVYGHSNGVRQTYFQSRDPRAALSSPSERDPGMNIEERAAKMLLQDHNIHLI